MRKFDTCMDIDHATEVVKEKKREEKAARKEAVAKPQDQVAVHWLKTGFHGEKQRYVCSGCGRKCQRPTVYGRACSRCNAQQK